MTRVLVGTYRERQYIEDALRSIDRYLANVTDLVFIDDSANTEHRLWLAQYGKVIPVGSARQGYTAAMRTLCAAAENQQAFVFEEDFTLTSPVDLAELAEILWYRPYLAQIALLRNAWFPNEIQAGGVIEALERKGYQFRTVADVIEQSATFTCNPSLWRADVFSTGWPANGRWTEEIKRDELIRRGYRFGWLPGIKCEHHGQRQGFGY